MTMFNELVYSFCVNDSGNLVIQGSTAMKEELKKYAGKKGVLKYKFKSKEVKGLAVHVEKDLVPQFKKSFFEKGMYYSEVSILKYLWRLSDVTRDLIHDSLYKLEDFEMYLFIADLRRIASEEFNFFLITYND